MSQPKPGPKPRKRLAPSEKYEMFIQVLTQQATQRHTLLLRPDVAAVNGRQVYHSAEGDTEDAPLYVMAKQVDGRWLLHTCRNTEVQLD